MAEVAIAHCRRCGARCRVGGAGNPGAKMLRRSNEPKGLCVNCATHDWLRNTYPVNMLLAENGPKILVHWHIREQFADIMRCGMADAKPDEINWNLMNENWDLPFPHKIKRSAANPCSQQDLDEIKSGKRRGLGQKIPAKNKYTICNPPKVVRSFRELNEVEAGLGDELKSLLETQRNPKQRSVKMAKKKKKHVDEMLIDVYPENIMEIVEAARVYKKHQKDRMAFLAKEVAQKQVVLDLIKAGKMKTLDGGKIKFEYDSVLITIKPRDELITVKEQSPKG